MSHFTKEQLEELKEIVREHYIVPGWIAVSVFWGISWFVGVYIIKPFFILMGFVERSALYF